MKSYLDMLRNILDHGTVKVIPRVKYSTIGVPNLHFTHDLNTGFPLLTTRRLAWKGLVGELRSFLEGCSNNGDFIENGCNFWTPWARPGGDLGPIYGVQWCNHGQLEHVISSLAAGRDDRRMVVSAWRPDEHKLMVLPPCHLMWVVTPYDGQLNLSWFQRSCDFPIGVPYNIASYALLAHILAVWGKLQVGKIDAIFCDSHIYENQLDGLDKQLLRKPGTLPEIRVWFEDDNDFFSWQVELIGYEPQSAIDMGELAV
jgi:thymidylate synthase